MDTRLSPNLPRPHCLRENLPLIQLLATEMDSAYPTHSCPHCRRLVLSVPRKARVPCDYDMYKWSEQTSIRCDHTTVRSALDDGCPLYVSLVKNYSRLGRTLDDLLQGNIVIVQNWNAVDDRSGYPGCLLLLLCWEFEMFLLDENSPWIKFALFASAGALQTKREYVLKIHAFVQDLNFDSRRSSPTETPDEHAAP